MSARFCRWHRPERSEFNQVEYDAERAAELLAELAGFTIDVEPDDRPFVDVERLLIWHRINPKGASND
jgi:hypothetical protein